MFISSQDGFQCNERATSLVSTDAVVTVRALDPACISNIYYGVCRIGARDMDSTPVARLLEPRCHSVLY